MCAALAIHAVDELVTGYLDVHNSTVLALRERYPLIALPTLTFNTMLLLLIFAVVVLVALSPLVWKGKWAMRPISHVYAAVMLSNGLGHIAHSIFMQELMPGVYTSPLLLVTSIVLLKATRAHKRSRNSTTVNFVES